MKKVVLVNVLLLIHLLTFFGAALAQHEEHAGLPGHTPWDRIPDFGVAPSIASVQAGDWSAPSTWNLNRIPNSSDSVLIVHNVAFATTTGQANTIRVSAGGSLTFNPAVNTALTVKTLFIIQGGTLTIGTAAAPVADSVKAEIIFADLLLDTVNDPSQYGNGLISLGKVTMHGAIKTPTFVRLDDEPDLSNGTKLTISQSITGWKSGDRIILPRSEMFAAETYPESHFAPWELLTFGSVAGNQVTLAAPFQYKHPGAHDADGNLVIVSRPGSAPFKLLPHIGNLTRNVVLRSQNPSGVRGHVLFTHRADVDIRYVLFKDLGRTKITPLDVTTYDANGNVTHIGTNQIGRYSLHMHHVMGPVPTPVNGYQYTLVGNAIDGGTKWGITVHDSHYGLVKANVIYGAPGAGIMTEWGNEAYNEIDGNFMVATRGTGDERGDGRSNQGDFGYEGSGLWLAGPYNYVRNNVIANTNGFALSLFMLRISNRLPLFKGADTSAAGEYSTDFPLNILQLKNNEMYSTFNAVTIWNLNAQCCTAVYDGPWSNLEDMTVWNNSRYGLYGYGSNKTYFNRWIQIGDADVIRNVHEFPQLHFGDYISRNVVFDQARIENIRGLVIPVKGGDTSDIYGNAPATTIIRNSYFRNTANVIVPSPWGVTGGGTALPPRVVFLDNNVFRNLPASYGIQNQVSIAMSYNIGTNSNLMQRNEIYVKDYMTDIGQPGGRNYRIYYTQQNPSFVVPVTGYDPGTGGNVGVGSPQAGLTNTQLWASFGKAFGGAVARRADNLLAPEVGGYVDTITPAELAAVPIAPDIFNMPPAAPMNLREVP